MRETSVAHSITFTVQHGDVFMAAVDVLAFAHPSTPHGLETQVMAYLRQFAVHDGEPAINESLLLDTRDVPGIHADRVLFLGVPPLREFGYRQIRAFTRQVLGHLAVHTPTIREVAVPLSSPELGLDEVEAATALLAGVVDAIRAQTIPMTLTRVAIMEPVKRRAQYVQDALAQTLSGVEWASRETDAWEYTLNLWDARYIKAGSQAVEAAGVRAKPHVFIAVPFDEAMDDLVHEVIQPAIHASGLLCSRATRSAHAELFPLMAQRIAAAEVVVAEISRADPDVYVELGYAWGTARPSILLMRDPSTPAPWTHHPCTRYESYPELTDILSRVLKTWID